MSDRFDEMARKLVYGAKRCVTSEDVGVAERLAEALRKFAIDERDRAADICRRAEQYELAAKIANHGDTGNFGRR